MKQSNKKAINITGIFTVWGGGVQGAKIFVNDQSRRLGAPLAKCLEILCAAMPYSAAWIVILLFHHRAMHFARNVSMPYLKVKYTILL